MFRLLILAGLPVGVVAGTSASPVPKPRIKESELYYPTRVGTKWVEEHESRGEVHAVITKSEIKGDSRHVHVAYSFKDGTQCSTLRIAVSERGVYRLAVNDQIDTPPVCWLKLPFKHGDSWDSFGFHHVVGRPEEIQVPAGKYPAIPVELSSSLLCGQMADGGGHGLAGLRFSSTRWFAPGVGMIRQVNGADFVMKSFTPVKG